MYNMAHQSQVFVFACFFISTTPSSDWLKAAASWLLSWKTKLKWWIGSRRIHFLANIAFWAPGTDVRFRPKADTSRAIEEGVLPGVPPQAGGGQDSLLLGRMDDETSNRIIDLQAEVTALRGAVRMLIQNIYGEDQRTLAMIREEALRGDDLDAFDKEQGDRGSRYRDGVRDAVSSLLDPFQPDDDQASRLANPAPS
jgi:hypothetical protein